MMYGLDRKLLPAIALCLLLAAGAGCFEKRPGKAGIWPWSEDDTDEMAKFGPNMNQRLAELQSLAGSARRSSEEDRQRISRDLAARLAAEQMPVVRAEIVRTLAHYPSALANEAVQMALADSDPEVRVACCRTWGAWGGPQGAQMLGQALSSDTNMDVRMAAARALGQTGQPGAVPSLGLALEDPDPALQFCAVQSLRELSGKDYGNDVKAWRQFAAGQPVQQREQSIADRMPKLF